MVKWNSVNSIYSIDFFVSILPLVVAHLAVPPLSYLEGKEYIPEPLYPVFRLIYNNIPSNFMSLRYVSSLGLVKDSSLMKKPFFEAGWISSMFVHGTFQHLLNNLTAMIQLAWPIYRDYGPIGLYYMFFFGGIAANIPNDAIREFLENQIYQLDELTIMNQTIVTSRPVEDSSIVSKANSLFSMLVKKTKESLIAQPIHIGSSGAVCALMGYDLSAIMHDLSISLITAWNESDEKNKWKFYGLRESNESRLDRFRKLIPWTKFTMNVFELARGLLYLQLEISRQRAGGLLNGQQIDHEAHIKGIVFGFISGFFLNCAVPLIF